VFIDSDAGQPLYRRIAASLQGSIKSGVYPVGAVLPTEIELSQTFGVCRQTVRDALRILGDSGLVLRRRRVGTVVVGRAPAPSFVQPLHGFEEVLQYSRNARLSIDQYGPATGSRLLRQLKLDATKWLGIEGLRGPGTRPVGMTTALIRRDCAPTREVLDKRSMAISEVIERNSGLSTTRIEQEITACALTKREADALLAVSGAPGLRMLRRYFDQKDTCFLISLSVHPSERFFYTMSFNRYVAKEE
jgi:GntR family transcriptional regulator